MPNLILGVPSGNVPLSPPTVAREAIANLNIANPLVAWLVYRGDIVSSSKASEQALGFWLMRALAGEANTGHRAALFADELTLEMVRQAEVPGAVSRLRGFYLFDDTESADRAAGSWGGPFHRDAITEVGILSGSRWSRHDAQWITKKMGSNETDWMTPYLRGEPAGPEPIWELVVDGRAVVFGTMLREAAYEVVARAWPTTLALLEVARIASWLDSDAGLIVPMHYPAEGGHRVAFCINMADFDDQAFVERVHAFDGPVRTTDLHLGSDLVLPDLRAYGFELPAPSA